MPRLFLGIPIPEPHCQQISRFVNEIPHQAGIRWVKPENYHVTLAFFGEVPAEMIHNLKEVLRVGLVNRSEFVLEFYTYSLAPSNQEPRMIWVRWKKNPNFQELSKKVNSFYKQLSSTHSFRKSPMPHITLARLKSGVDWKALSLQKGEALPILKVRKLVLWETRKHEDTVSYHPLIEIPLIRAGL